MTVNSCQQIDAHFPAGSQFQLFSYYCGRLLPVCLNLRSRRLLLPTGRASDVVVGQIQRYMGYVSEELAEDGQEVRGLIIALEDDTRIKRALVVTKGIDFYKYEVNFKLIPVTS